MIFSDKISGDNSTVGFEREKVIVRNTTFRVEMKNWKIERKFKIIDKFSSKFLHHIKSMGVGKV